MRCHRLSALGSRLSVACGALVCLVPAAAAAQARVFDVTATPIYHWGAFGLSNGQSVEFSTQNLSPASADTVLHLWDVTAGTEVAYNDDYTSGNASLISFTNTTGISRNYRLWMRAASAATAGTADVLRDGALFAADVPVGGVLRDVVNGTSVFHETVQVSGGPTSSFVLGLDATGHLTGWNQTGGLGSMSRLTPTSATTHVVVGTPYWVTGGPMRLVTHNPANDADADGLDDQTELSTLVATCTPSSCTLDPARYHTRADTDRDGILDGAEVLGFAGTLFDNHLFAWGANPRRKDIFVEVDFEDSFSANPFSLTTLGARQAWIQTIVSAFSSAAGDEVMNPDGSAGVAVHIDAGINVPGFATSIGAWGGGGTPVVTGTSYGDARNDADYMEPARRAVFRYALALASGGGGQQSGGALQWGFGPPSGGSAGVALTFAHELGHSIGLRHWGHSALAPHQLNGAPGYTSIMNYCSQAAGSTGFSDGDGASLVVNGASTDESFSTTSIALANLLNQSVWDFATSLGAGWADFSRDGLINNASVRAPVRWCTWAADGALSSDATDQVIGTSTAFSGTPDLIRVGARLYLFYINAGNLRYRYSETMSGTANASCPNGDEVISQTAGGVGCIDWSGWYSISAPTGVTPASVTAAPWNGAAIAIRGTNNQVYAGRWTTAAPTLSGWSGWTNVAAGIGEVELSVVPVDDATWGVPLRLGLFFASPTGVYRQFFADATPIVWSVGADVRTVATQGGNVVTGTIGCDVAPWPGTETLVAYDGVETACGAFPDSAGAIRLLCLDRASHTARWIDVTSQSFNIGSSCTACAGQPTVDAKPALRFHMIRQTDGSRAYTNGAGHFWLTVSPSGTRFANTYVSAVLSGNVGLAAIPFVSVGKFFNEWSDPVPFTGVAYLSDLAIGALKAIWITEAAGTGSLRFVPMADGSIDAPLSDYDDWKVMERGVCLADGLRASALCGASGFWGGGL